MHVDRTREPFVSVWRPMRRLASILQASPKTLPAALPTMEIERERRREQRVVARLVARRIHRTSPRMSLVFRCPTRTVAAGAAAAAPTAMAAARAAASSALIVIESPVSPVITAASAEGAADFLPRLGRGYARPR